MARGGLGPCSALLRGRGLPILVRSPVRGQTKWFLRRLPVDSRATRWRDHPVGAILCWMVGCPGCDALGGGSQLCRDKHSYHVGPVFKTTGSREVADLALETSSSGLSGKEDSPPQEPPAAVSCSGSFFLRDWNHACFGIRGCLHGFESCLLSECRLGFLIRGNGFLAGGLSDMRYSIK
ncbi:hypothetical protein E2C01_006042 [Portunus trituberculatus]|uniref:Uncharacterized protein n=1 Tax=Portunus trituberculatus TaxID=210409 RepID=A0A5B7CWT5_PORTR|nr:hypothetical protein [Portunus trituberculatus]